MCRSIFCQAVVLVLALVSILAGTPGPARGGEPSPAYKASLKRTAELRRERRRAAAAAPVGVIVPYPMPPSLIIRQTPEAHDEIGALLRLLRGGGSG